MGQVGDVFIHHTATGQPQAFDAAFLRQVEAAEMGRGDGLIAVAYHRLVFPNGDVAEGRPWGTKGGATINNNSTSVAVCFVGNFQTDVPTSAAVDAAANELKGAVAFGIIPPNFTTRPHSDVFATACPGVNLRPLVSVIDQLGKQPILAPPPQQESYMVISIDGATCYAVTATTINACPAVPNPVRVTQAQYDAINAGINRLNQAIQAILNPPAASGQGGTIDYTALANAVADKLAARLAS